MCFRVLVVTLTLRACGTNPLVAPREGLPWAITYFSISKERLGEGWRRGSRDGTVTGSLSFLGSLREHEGVTGELKSSTAIGLRKHRIPSDLRSEPGYRLIRTMVGDHTGILGAVVNILKLVDWFLATRKRLSISGHLFSRLRCSGLAAPLPGCLDLYKRE